MSSKDKNKYPLREEDIDASGGDAGGSESGGGEGQSGQVEFREFIAGERLRDDLLPADEKRRLLAVHQDLHESRVKKQKETREQRQALKDGKIPLQTYRQEMAGMGMSSQYKVNPILANKAQFSGIDRQVNALPNENVAETNKDMRDELTYQYQLRYMPENAPRFHPKPQYR